MSVPRLPDDTDLPNRLLAGLTELGLALTSEQHRQLLDYLALLARWNRVYNLTALRDSAQMLTHHLLDSLAVIAPLRRYLGELDQAGPSGAQSARPVRLLDVGSGGGLPGVVIAICQPDIAVTCVDAVAKKAAFIGQTAGTLRLPNLTGLHARVESLGAEKIGTQIDTRLAQKDSGKKTVAPVTLPIAQLCLNQSYDIIVSRAFASLADFTALSRGALAEGGVWLAMKGKPPDAEAAALPPDVEMFHVEQLTVPGLDAQRCLAWLRLRGTTA